MKKIIISIDGFSSTGKSTIAKLLASKLNYVYVDTGAMYRAVTFFALTNKIILKGVLDKDKLIANLPKIKLSFSFVKEKGFSEINLNDNNIESKIRSLEVSNWVSRIAEISKVRRKLVHQQQNIGKSKGIVMDGRDIGTVVFPDAELKIFMTASAEIRAERRFKELVENGEKVTYENVLENVKQRDFIDSTREDSPLIKAKDAIIIDNSNLTINEQVEKIYELALIKISA
ncbi:MAG: (d)CMP kinase [Lutibacter sp.]